MYSDNPKTQRAIDSVLARYHAWLRNPKGGYRRVGAEQ